MSGSVAEARGFLARVLGRAIEGDREQASVASSRALAAILSSAKLGDRSLLTQAEAAVREEPTVIDFTERGTAEIRVGSRRLGAGRFWTPTLGELGSDPRPDPGGRVMFSVIDGASPLTDIGALQATADPNTLFQVASQFNCLESPGPYVTPVERYLTDPTQGPRAAVSAFPAALLRHYAAPHPDGGSFVQQTDGPQIELLASACGEDVAPNGYLTGEHVADPQAFAERLEAGFGDVRVGVHSECEVVYGYDWDGGVEQGGVPITQVLTSTVAGGVYGGAARLGQDTFDRVSTLLLRAAYLGTLRAALRTDQTTVVLTLIGGGVFRNALPDIWSSLCWALDRIAGESHRDLHVVLNGRSLAQVLDLEHMVRPEVAARGGAYVRFDEKGLAEL